MSSPSEKTIFKIKDSPDPSLLSRKVIGEALVSIMSSKMEVRLVAPEPVEIVYIESVVMPAPDPASAPDPSPELLAKMEAAPFSHITTQTVIKIIDNGLSIVVFRELCDLLNIPDKALAGVIKIPISTLAKRKKRGYFSSTESERIYRILNLYKQALDTFDGNEEYARKWLKEDAYGLGGVPPLEFAKTELGAKEVEQLLIRIDEGIFA